MLQGLADYFLPKQDDSISQSRNITPSSSIEDDEVSGSDAIGISSFNIPRRTAEGLLADTKMPIKKAAPSIGDDNYRPLYPHAMLAGGLGGTMGDMLMHSLDTVKTRQQGDPHMPPKYTSMGNTYYTIFRQEGVARGLYSGVTPAFLGSFSGTLIFFGCYEWTKRRLIDAGVTPWAAYLASGFMADLMASPLYVPSEVLKTRLQLQGRYNNPFFYSGYNYRSTSHALRTIWRTEGAVELFSGYKATLFRDLPFSAIQFAVYEQELKLAQHWVGPGKEIGVGWEIVTGATAGGIAGFLTCPMDVVKTRIQTELDPDVAFAAKQRKKSTKQPISSTTTAPQLRRPSTASQPHAAASAQSPKKPLPASRQYISTSGPNTTLARHGPATLDTESVLKALRIIYRTEGLAGWFRGVGPRVVWTSVQSGTMLFVYQRLLRWFEYHPLLDR